MFKLPEVSRFIYNGTERVAIEKGIDKRPGAGILTFQVSPEKGVRTFKPAKMIDRKKLGRVATIVCLAKSVRIG